MHLSNVWAAHTCVSFFLGGLTSASHHLYFGVGAVIGGGHWSITVVVRGRLGVGLCRDIDDTCSI